MLFVEVELPFGRPGSRSWELSLGRCGHFCRRRPPPYPPPQAGEDREGGAALRQHVRVSTGVCEPFAVSFRGNHSIDDTVEKVAIVTDEKHGAGIVADHLL